MSRIARAWERYELWRIDRCREENVVGRIVIGTLILATSALWVSLLPDDPDWLNVATGALLFTTGWSLLGGAFWERQVCRLKAELARRPDAQ